MTARINQAEQAEALSLIERQNQLAGEMARARGDVALEQLEASMNNDLVNEARIEAMTPEELEDLRELDRIMFAYLTTPEAIAEYSFEEAKAHGLFMAEFYNEPLASIFRDFYGSYTPAMHAELLTEMQEAAQARIEATARVTEARESAGFTPVQADFLTAPDLQLATLVAQVESEGGAPEAKMNRLRVLMAQKVRTSFNEWLRESRQLMSSMGGDDLSAFESGLAEESLGVRQTSTQAVGRAAGAVGNAAGNVFGNLSQFSFTPLSQHSFLSSVFTNRTSISAAYASLNASSGDVDRLVNQQVQELTGNLTYEQLASRFVLIPDNPSEMTDDQLRALEGKMETVPKFFRNKDFANQYYNYLRESVGGDLTMADDFQEWFNTLDMHPLMKMFYQFIMMIPDEIMDYFDGSEDDKTDAEINGEDLQAIRDELGRRASDTDEEAADLEGDTALTEVERNTYLNGLSQYVTLRDDFREIMGNPNARPDILHNGEPLGTTPLSTEEEHELTAIAALVREEPSAVELLGKGLELSDIVYLVEHQGDQHADGVNVEFSTTGINIYADLAHYLPDGFTNFFDREYVAGTAAVGSTAALVAFSGVFWPLVLGGLAGIGVAYVVGEGGWITLEDISYDALDASTLGSIVDRITDASETIRETTAQRVRQLEALTTTERQEFLESSGILEIQEDIPEFWGDYQLTSLDVLLFNEFEDGTGDHSFDQSNWFSMFHADSIGEGDEYIDESGAAVTAEHDMRGFQVEGTGSWLGLFTRDNYYDYRFKNVESFFAWLRTSPRAAELQAEIEERETT